MTDGCVTSIPRGRGAPAPPCGQVNLDTSTVATRATHHQSGHFQLTHQPDSPGVAQSEHIGQLPNVGPTEELIESQQRLCRAAGELSCALQRLDLLVGQVEREGSQQILESGMDAGDHSPYHMTHSYTLKKWVAMTGVVATATIDVQASPERVWEALTDPAQIASYLGGSVVETTWEVGSQIIWSGEYDGRAYQDKGEVLVFDEPHVLSFTHYSPLMGQDDRPENYHTLVYTISLDGDSVTHLSLTQDNCTDDAQAERFSLNWQGMLTQMKEYIER